MEVRFGTALLQQCYEQHRLAVREWGADVARRYVERVTIIMRVKSVAELNTFTALKFHPLVGDRKGQYAIKLTGFMRLIVSFDDRAMTIARVEEVSKHYDD